MSDPSLVLLAALAGLARLGALATLGGLSALAPLLLTLVALVLLIGHLYISMLDFILDPAKEESQVRGSGTHKRFVAIAVRLVLDVVQIFIIRFCLGCPS